MKEIRNLHTAFPRVLNGRSSIEALEFPPAVGEWRESLSKNPGREPAFCCRIRCKALNGFQSAVELLVHALNEICRSWTIDMEDGFSFHVSGELLAALENVIHGGELHGIIVMPGRSPPNAGLKTILAEEGNVEDVFLHFRKKCSVGFFASGLECATDVLEEVHVADLGDAAWEDVLRSHADGIILIAGNAPQRVVHVLELREELDHCLKVLGGGKKADGNVVRDVIHAVDEGNLLLVAFDGDVFPIHNQRASEALPVAVPGGDIVVMRQCLQLLHQACVRRIEPSPNSAR